MQNLLVSLNCCCCWEEEMKRRVSPPYFVGPRCVFVCVCVCLCVYSRVGASYVGRPICVCAVSAPLRRVNTYKAPHRG